MSGRLVNWAIELGEFNIEFHPRTSLKGQVLADFMAEFCNFPEEVESPRGETWVAYVDGSSTQKYSGIGVVLKGPTEEECEAAIQLIFTTTNNEAEYKAIITGINMAQEMGLKSLEIMSDSQVVVRHIKGEYEARGDKMKWYLTRVKEAIEFFDKIAFTKVPQEENEEANTLARIGSSIDEEITVAGRPVQELAEPSITWMTQVARIEEGQGDPEWGHDILQFLREGKLPSDNKLARKIPIQATRYTLIDGTLYRRGYTLPLLKCLSKTDASYVFQEIHEDICGSHFGGRMLAYKAVQAGYCWPGMSKDW